jgi:DNA-directed RNA polymerase subunit H (RpoH/RPB5)
MTDDNNEEEVFYYHISKFCVCYIHPSVKGAKVCDEGEKVQVWMQVEVRYSEISKILFDDPSIPMHTNI